MNPDYLAGFLDGEGCFYFNFRERDGQSTYVVLTVHITNRNLAILELIQKSYGGKMRTYQNKHNRINRLEIFNRNDLQRLCGELKDRLIIKKRHAELIYNFCLKYPGNKRNRYQPEDIEALQEIRTLNAIQRHREEFV